MPYSEQVVEDCYHEAAHAVFWHRAGVEITDLYVYGEGKARTEWPDSPAPNRALDIAAGCLAGSLSWYPLRGHEINPLPFDDLLSGADLASAAELMAPPGSSVDPELLRGILPEEHGDDYEDALVMLEKSQPDCGGLEECYSEAIERVRRGFDERWEEIRAVAVALMVHGRVRGGEAVRIMDSAGGSAKDAKPSTERGLGGEEP